MARKIIIEENPEDLIIRHLEGTDSDSEASALLGWLGESDGNKEVYAAFAAAAAGAKVMASGKGEEIAESVSKKTRAASIWRKIRLYAIPAAAAAALVFALLPKSGTTPAQETQQRYISYQNNSQEINAVILEDNSKVWLGSGSSILFSQNEAGRTAELSGSAYFDVAKDSLKPFTVKTSGLGVKVLGTTFSVESPAGSKTTTVVLESGSIRLISPRGDNLLRMLPDQKAVYDNSTEDVVIEAETALPYMLEKFNLVSLTDVTLDEIIAHINGTYGVNISAADSYDKSKRYTLNFNRTDSIAIVLSTIETMTGVKIAIINT